MSDLSELKRLEQQTGVLRLSEAIREGAKRLDETRDKFCGCAIGTGYWQKTGRYLDDDAIASAGVSRSHRDEAFRLCAKEFGIRASIVRSVSDMHEFRGLTREQCADYLAAKGL